jgi:hypothetical protein
MTGQNNETFESRLTNGVLEAVIKAGWPYGDGNSSIDMRKTLDALCGAVAMFATTTIGLAEGPEAAARELERQAIHLSEMLNFLAGKARSGDLGLPPGDRPKPRLVE